MVLYGYMNNEENTQRENIQVTQPVVNQPAVLNQSIPTKKRGRPRVSVNWPNSDFTFESLMESNKALSSSSLRKKMRSELVSERLRKVGTMKTAFGRPKNVYSKLT